MNLASLVIYARNQLHDRKAIAWSDNHMARLAFEAVRIIQRRTRTGKVNSAIATVADQRDYAMPARVEQPIRVEYDEGKTHRPLDFMPFRDMADLAYSEGDPSWYSFSEDRKLWLYPVPAEAADTSTVQDNPLTATATTVTVATADFAEFPDRGLVKIENEWIEYRKKGATNTLENCVRGIEGTNPAQHIQTTLITYLNIRVYGVRRVVPSDFSTIYNNGNIAIANGAAIWTATGLGVSFSNVIKRNDEIGVTADPVMEDPFRWYAINNVGSATVVNTNENYEGATETKANYIISSPNPLDTDQHDDLVLTYFLAHAAMADQNRKMYVDLMNEFAGALGLASMDALQVDRPMTIQGFYDRRGGRSKFARVSSSQGGYWPVVR